MHLFNELDDWDVSIKHFENLGDKGFADHWRTKLARESSLTIDEAAAVKKVADEWLKGQQDKATAFDALRKADPAAFEARRATARDPLVQKQQIADLDRAIAQLVTSLGSKEFSKLDFYTRHMVDRSRAYMEAGRQHALADQEAKQ